MAATQDLEKSLNDLFVNNMPALPQSAKKLLVQYLPWITLILGILMLLAAYQLWQWAHVVSVVNNAFYNYYGYTAPTISRFSGTIWLSLIVLVVEAVIYIAAFPATQARKKSGWNLLFYALLVNIVYGVVVMFTNYGGLGSLIGSLIGSAIGMYILFQIRQEYTGTTSKAAPSQPKKA